MKEIKLIYGGNGTGKTFLLEAQASKNNGHIIRNTDIDLGKGNNVSFSVEKIKKYNSMRGMYIDLFIKQAEISKTDLNIILKFMNVKDLSGQEMLTINKERGHKESGPSIEIHTAKNIIATKSFSVINDFLSDNKKFELGKLNAMMQVIQEDDILNKLIDDGILEVTGNASKGIKTSEKITEYFKSFTRKQLFGLSIEKLKASAEDINTQNVDDEESLRIQLSETMWKIGDDICDIGKLLKLAEDIKNDFDKFDQGSSENIAKLLPKIPIIESVDISENESYANVSFVDDYVLSTGERTLVTYMFDLFKNQNSAHIYLDDPFEYLDSKNTWALARAVVNKYKSSDFKLSITSHNDKDLDTVAKIVEEVKGVSVVVSSLVKGVPGKKASSKTLPGSKMSLRITDDLIHYASIKKPIQMTDGYEIIYLTYFASARYYGKVGDIFSSKGTINSRTISYNMGTEISNNIIHYNDQFNNVYFIKMFPRLMKKEGARFSTSVEFVEDVIKRIHKISLKSHKSPFGISPLSLLDFGEAVLKRQLIERDASKAGKYICPNIDRSFLTTTPTLEAEFDSYSNIIHELDY